MKTLFRSVVLSLLLTCTGFGQSNAVVYPSETAGYIRVAGVDHDIEVETSLGRFFMGFGLAAGVYLLSWGIRIVLRGLGSAHHSE